MKFSVDNSMYQLGSSDEILRKLQISYVTEAYVATMHVAQHTGEVWVIYLK